METMATTTKMEASGNINKRRRYTNETATSIRPINDLPDSLLQHVALPVSLTSHAFFASAVTADAKQWEESNWQLLPSTASRAIMSGGNHSLDELDFVCIDKSRRSRLTDGELGGALVCMNAKEHLKSLKLTHCFGLVGAGLEPLRGSLVLERVDFSLVEQHESPVIVPDPAISVDAIIPILDSIIGMEGNSLRLVQFANKWRQAKSVVLNQFLEKV